MIKIANSENIQKGADILANGGVVAFPTETVYGLGADMNNEEAIKRVFEVKNRPLIDPLIVHIADLKTLEKIAIVHNENAQKLIDAFWPGPMTLILPKKDCVKDIVTSGLDTVAIRMPNHPVALELIAKSTGTIVAPSANPFGYLSPTTAEHVDEPLGEKIDMVLDGGNCEVGVESTVIDMSGEIPRVLRPGKITPEDIIKITGEVDTLNRKSKKPMAPGQFPMHYSPRTPLILLSDRNELPLDAKESAFLGLSQPKDGYKVCTVLSETSSLEEAAHNLFTILHDLDKQEISAIYVEPMPSESIGKAIIDRLYKASKK